MIIGTRKSNKNTSRIIKPLKKKHSKLKKSKDNRETFYKDRNFVCKNIDNLIYQIDCDSDYELSDNEDNIINHKKECKLEDEFSVKNILKNIDNIIFDMELDFLQKS